VDRRLADCSGVTPEREPQLSALESGRAVARSSSRVISTTADAPSSELGLLAPGGRERVAPKPARMNTTAMDTIAGSKLLEKRFRSRAFQPEQAVMHGDRRATFIRMHDGAAIIRHWGDSRAVAVPPGSLSLPEAKRRTPPRA
jgi:hypothetical protein